MELFIIIWVVCGIISVFTILLYSWKVSEEITVLDLLMSLVAFVLGAFSFLIMLCVLVAGTSDYVVFKKKKPKL